MLEKSKRQNQSHRDGFVRTENVVNKMIKSMTPSLSLLD